MHLGHIPENKMLAVDRHTGLGWTDAPDRSSVHCLLSPSLSVLLPLLVSGPSSPVTQVQADEARPEKRKQIRSVLSAK